MLKALRHAMVPSAAMNYGGAAAMQGIQEWPWSYDVMGFRNKQTLPGFAKPK
jgi:hypothetical protein